MVSFYIYDITFLVLFTAIISFFLYKNRAKMAREGIMYMYRGGWGMQKIINFEKRFHKILSKMKYLIVAVGYGLMITMMYMLLKTVWLYLARPELTSQIKAPPIAPLIPYFPQLFGMESYFPPFYFTYFLVSIAVVMIVHEFSHGIFMRLSKTKIKSTGIVFLGPILGAFVEQDDVSFQKKKRFDQMTILAAGVFANFVFAILFYLLYIGFFALSFNATGAVFSDYAIGIVNVSQIDGQFDGKGYTVLIVGNNNYFLNEAMELQLANNSGLIYAYYDSPAFRAQMKGVITQINDVQIRSANDIRLFMQEKSPGDIITITTTLGEYEIELEEHPYDLEVPFIGISYSGVEPVGIWENFLVSFSGFMPETINYETTWDGDLVYFIYHMLWWIMIINFLVALFNMLPLGILDGGRFFYLTVEKFTNEKVAAKAFRLMTQFIIFLFAAMMFLWAIRLF